MNCSVSFSRCKFDFLFLFYSLLHNQGAKCHRKLHSKLLVVGRWANKCASNGKSRIRGRTFNCESEKKDNLEGERKRDVIMIKNKAGRKCVSEESAYIDLNIRQTSCWRLGPRVYQSPRSTLEDSARPCW